MSLCAQCVITCNIQSVLRAPVVLRTVAVRGLKENEISAVTLLLSGYSLACAMA